MHFPLQDCSLDLPVAAFMLPRGFEQYPVASVSAIRQKLLLAWTKHSSLWQWLRICACAAAHRFVPLCADYCSLSWNILKLLFHAFREVRKMRQSLLWVGCCSLIGASLVAFSVRQTTIQAYTATLWMSCGWKTLAKRFAANLKNFHTQSEPAWPASPRS